MLPEANQHGQVRWCAFVIVLLAAFVASLVVACHSRLDKADTNTQGTTAVNSNTQATTDITFPVIESVNVSEITESSATITWLTDVEAFSQVQYGKTAFNLYSDSKIAKLAKRHRVILKQLDAGATYYFIVRSGDASGHIRVSDIYTFTTLPPVGCEVGKRAPDFTLKDLDGEDVTLSDYSGKVVVLNFWFIECPPCVEELPYLQEAFRSWSGEGRAVLLTVYHCPSIFRTTARDVDMWMTRNQYSLPVLFDQEGALVKKYCVRIFPSTFFIDPVGTIRYVKPGFFHSRQDIEKILHSF